MSLYGYQRKTKPANWMHAFPPPAVEKKVHRLRRVSKVARASGSGWPALSRELVAEAHARGDTCPVVANVPELRYGVKYGWSISVTIDQCHHVFGRGHGGRGPLLMDRRLIIPVSKQGHRWIDSHRADARAMGWLAPQGWYNEPVPENASVRRNEFGGLKVWLADGRQIL